MDARAEVPTRDVANSEVHREFTSPAFLMPPPTVWHPARIPADALAAMQVSWGRLWFAPRPVRICVLEDVFVAAEGLVFTRKLDAVRPTVEQHSAEAVAQARACLQTLTQAVPRIRGDVVLCRKSGAGNYGHWLAEMLPRAWFAAQHWPSSIRPLVQHVADPLRTVMRDSLACIGQAGFVEAGADPVLVDRLILVEGLSEHGVYMSPWVAECLEAITATIHPDGADRLFVVRSGETRRFADEAPLCAAAVEAGFRVLDPASVPFRAQVAAFKAARRVAGAMGAGLTNLMFAPKGAETFILAPAAMPDTFFWFIAGLRGLHHVEIRCAQAAHTELLPWDAPLYLDLADERRILRESVMPPVAPSSACELAAVVLGLFDPAHYRTVYPDVARAAIEPLAHYITIGWQEGRNPSRAFDTNAYLRAYPDVAAARFNPLLHFALYGQREGRSPVQVPA